MRGENYLINIEYYYTKYGTPIKIIEYINFQKVLIEFQDEHKITKYVTKDNLSNGRVSNPYDKKIYGVGYIGIGEYKPSANKRMTKEYVRWSNMMRRCYSTEYKNLHQTYRDCAVCNEWHNFQNFAIWFNQNIYFCPEELHLDKDILIKNNKLYSPETCVLIPKSLNKLLTKTNKLRGDCPIGVTKHFGKYEVKCNIGDGSSKYLGSYENLEDAFNTYKKFKENIIAKQAKKYKEFLDIKTYNALVNYVVDIDD